MARESPACGRFCEITADLAAVFRHERESQAFERYYRLGILSNVDNNSLSGTLGQFFVPFDVLLTAQDVGSYKPGLAHFEAALKKFVGLGIDRAEILHGAQSK